MPETQPLLPHRLRLLLLIALLMLPGLLTVRHRLRLLLLIALLMLPGLLTVRLAVSRRPHRLRLLLLIALLMLPGLLPVRSPWQNPHIGRMIDCQ